MFGEPRLAEVFLPDRQAPSLSVNQQEVATMARTVNRSARSGRFVSKAVILNGVAIYRGA